MAQVTGEWAQKNATTATYTIDGKVVVTVSGLPSGISISEIGVSGVLISTEDDKTGIVQFSSSALQGSSKITVTSSNGYSYEAQLDSTVTKSGVAEVKQTIATGTTNTLTITGNVTAGYQLAADKKSISYVAAAENKTLAKLEKLTAAATLGSVDSESPSDRSANVKINGTSITLDRAALPEGNVTLKSDYGYTLALGDVEKTTITGATLATSSGKATVTGTLTKGYSLSSDGKTVTYAAQKDNQTLATVTGLGTDTSGNVTFEDGVITLKKDALKNANVTLKLQNGADYKLALTTDGDGKVPQPEKQGEEWTYNNGTAVYKQDTSEGWDLNSDSLGVTYTAKVTDTYATVKGLAKIADNTETEDVNEALEQVKAGMTVSGSTITITDPDLLTTGNVTVTTGKGHEAYTLKIGDEIPTTAVNADIWAISGTTATYKNVDQAYYSEVESNGSIKYNKEANAKTLATVKGLSSTISEDDIEVTTAANGSTVGVITLRGNALSAKNVTLGAKDNYTFAFDTTTTGNEVPIPSVSGGTWNFDRNSKGVVTKATYTGTLTPGYRLSADGKTAIYIAAPKSGNPLITISGTLGTDVATDNFKVDDATGVITLSKGALGTSNITVKETGYRLALDENDNTILTDESSDVANGVDVWRISGTTATYKKVIPAYYTINDKGAIVYHKETDVKGGTQVTIKGLQNVKNGLSVSEDGQTFGITDENGYTPGISMASGVITLNKEVLTSTNVTLTNASGYSYTLALDNADDLAPEVNTDTDPKWSISGTTATLKGNIDEGWTKTSDTVITYSKAVTNGGATIATVKGLASGLTMDSNKTNIIAKGDTEETSVIEANNGVITVKEDALGTTDITVDGVGGYKLALENNSTGTNISTEPSWEPTSGTTAIYKEYTSPGFTLSSDEKTLTYSAGKFGNTLLTLTGIKSGLTQDELVYNKDEETGIEVDTETDSTKPTFILHKNVLGTTNISYTTPSTSAYKNAVLDVNDDVNTNTTTNGTPDWFVDSSGNAYLRIYTAESYTPATTGKTITYNAPTDRISVATITGLDTKKLQTAYGNDSLHTGEEGNPGVLEVEIETTDTTTGTITVDDSLLSKNTVKITNTQGTNYNYKLKLADTVDGDGKKRSTVTDDGEWTVSGGTATYTIKTTEGYYIPDADETEKTGTSIVYNSNGTLTTKISGLNTSAGDSDVSFDVVSGGNAKNAADRTGKILISDVALGGKNITLSNAKGYSYTLTLDENSSQDADGIEYGWSKSGTKATYEKKVVAEEYADGVYVNNGTSLTYYKPGSKIVGATLNGLNAGITELTKAYVKVEEGEDGEAGTITIMSRYALGTGNVTIGNKDNYKLVLSESADFTVQDTAARLNYDAKSGKTTLVQGKTAGWEPKLDKNGNADGKTILYTKPNLTTLATISGLKPNLNSDDSEIYDDEEGTITGLTFSTSGGTITVDSSLLTTKNVTLGSKDAYTISLSDADDAAPQNIDDDPYWEFKNGKATLIGGTTAGYTQKDSKTISYVKQVKKTLATISNLITDKAFADDSTNEDLELGVSADGKSIGVYDSEGDFTAYLTLVDKTGVITVYNPAILSEKTATLAPAKGTSYALAIDESAFESADALSGTTEPEWVKEEGKTTATYQKTVQAGYSLSSDAKSIVYTAGESKPTVLATLSGLVKDGDQDTLDLKNVITVTEGKNGAAGTIKLSQAAIGTTAENGDGRERADYTGDRTGIFGKNNISIAAKDNYTLVVDDEEAFAPTTDSAYWDLSTAGSAIYKQATSEGWEDKKDSKGYSTHKTLVYTKASTVNLATLSGLVKPSTKDGETVDTYYRVKGTESIDDERSYNTTVQANANATVEGADANWVDFFTVSGRVITFNSAATLVDKSKVTAKSGNAAYKYTLAVDDSIAPQSFTNPKPYLSGTTVTLKNAKTPGWVVDGKTSTTLSKAAQTSSDTVATITGLKKGIKSSVTDNIAIQGTTISIPQGALGTTDIVLNDSSNTGYTFASESWIKKDPDGSVLWTIANGSATLAQEIGGGYEISEDGKTIKYTEAKNSKTSTLVTISGLNKGTDDTYENANTKDLYFDATNKTITVNDALLGTSKVAAKSSDKSTTYTLVLGDDVATVANNVTEWVTSKGTATYKNYKKDYYTIDAKTGAIVYNKETKGTTYMTVSGLNTAASVDSGYTVSDTAKTITVDGGGLTTKNVTLKINDSAYSDYKLALGDSVSDSLTSTLTGGDYGDWTTSGATANLLGTITKGYSLTNDKTITYLKADKTKQKIATISNLKSGASVSDSEGVVTLSDDQLNAKDVVLTTYIDDGNNYTLDLGSVDAPTATVETGDSLTSAGWTVNKTKAVLKGAVSEGYILSASHKSITYTKATAENKTQDLVTITGLKTAASLTGDTGVNAETRKVSLNGGLLDSKVTIAGGAFEVSIDSAFSNSSLVGSATADSISVGGSNVTVSTGKGDDYVYLGGNSNTFIYATGDGNDVVADFTAGKDKIKVSKGTVTSVETVAALEGSTKDVLIKVDSLKGSIRLKGAAGKQVTILDAKDNSAIYTTSSSVGTATASGRLMTSDNFTTTPPQLSDLVGSSGSDYTVGNLDTTQDPTNLTNQSDVITYSDDK